MEPIVVAGAGQTEFRADRVEDTFADLVYEAAQAALADAGLSIADIDNVVTASNDFWDGRTISSMAIGDAAGAAFGDGKPVSTVEGDGLFAAVYGMSRILSGAYRTTLVVAHSKGSEGRSELITNAFFDPITERPIGLDAVSAGGLQARAFLDRWKPGADDCARVVVKNRGFGARNPKAHRREPVTADEALRSALVAEPLREADVCPVSDGAAAVVLAREDFARGRCPRPVRVRGVGFCADAPMTQRPLWESAALREAGRAAYRRAGVIEPSREIDAAEVSEQFSFQELLWRQELSLAVPERVNRSGGCLSAHAWIAAGLARLVEASLLLRGEGPNPIEARTALAHGQYGLCGQSHCVWVLGR
ncbi:MAG: thiolase family protein [Elusimicrobia bacterium]|nr:thiolase family protein [Elusimicrobiota bacterium]